MFPVSLEETLESAPGLASSSLSGGIVAVDQCRDVVAQYVIICYVPRYLFACSCPFIFVLPGYVTSYFVFLINLELTAILSETWDSNNRQNAETEEGVVSIGITKCWRVCEADYFWC